MGDSSSSAPNRTSTPYGAFHRVHCTIRETNNEYGLRNPYSLFVTHIVLCTRCNAEYGVLVACAVRGTRSGLPECCHGCLPEHIPPCHQPDPHRQREHRARDGECRGPGRGERGLEHPLR